jgi:hypothetical protein
MQPPVNITPISQFVQMIRSAELNNQKDVKIPIQQARLISLAITELLDKVNQDNESIFNALKKTVENTQVSIAMDGGGFENL